MTRIEFSTLITQQSPTLKISALRFTHDTDDAHDLVQDTLIKAITCYNTFKENTNLNAWLYTIMKHTFINNHRRTVRTRALIIRTEEMSVPDHMHSSNLNGGESRFLMADINNALYSLPREYHIPFTMYFNGHKYQEIAKRLSLPLGTIKTRIHSARRHLKKLLSAYNPIKN